MRHHASFAIARVYQLLFAAAAVGAAFACSGGAPEDVRSGTSADTASGTGGFLSYGGAIGANRCLDVPNGVAKGAELDSAPCNGTSAQQFLMSGTAIKPALATGYCLDMSNDDAQGGVVQLWPCNGLVNQQWVMQSGTIRPIGQQSFCLDLPAGSASSIRIGVQPCDGSINQLWWPFGATVQLESTEASGGSSLCLDVSQDSKTSGTPADNWGCGQTNDAQIFTLTAQNQIKNHGLCLGPAPGTHTGPLEMVTCDNALDQEWQFAPGPNGKLNLQSWGGGFGIQCLDVEGNNSAMGTRVDLTTCNDTTAQEWSPMVWSGSPQIANPLPMTGPFVQQFTAVDDYVQAYVQAYKINAATVAITYDKMLVYERGFGYQDAAKTTPILPDARMRLATNSTMFTRRALQQLIADGYLSPTTNVQQYLSQFFTLPTSTEPRLAQLQVQEIYDFTTCTSDADDIDNDQIEELENTPSPVTATQRLAYFWSNPQYIMPTSLPCPAGATGGTALPDGGTQCTFTKSCVPGSAFSATDGSYSNGFSHVSHEIAGAIVAAATYRMAGNTGFNDPSLVGPDGVGNWFGQYIENFIGPRLGARYYEADDDYANAPGSWIPNEIWYDSTGDSPATACPEWNYWACAHLKTQQPVPVAYHRDFFARPGSGTIVSSAADVARFLASYQWWQSTAPLPNSRSQMQGLGTWVGGGDLEGTKTLISNGATFYSGQWHFWTWTFLANHDAGVDTNVFDLSRVLDNSAVSSTPSGVFNTFQPTVDFWVDDTLVNRAYDQSASEGMPILQAPQEVNYAAGSAPLNPSIYPPYDGLPQFAYLWRVQPDANGFYVITNEWSGLALSNQDGDAYVESLTPQPTWWSEEWSLTSAPPPAQGYTQILNRWNGHGLHVQDQKGYVEQGTIQSSWPSADWQLIPVPSGLCCSNSTATNACPSGQPACLCGAANCPAFQP